MTRRDKILAVARNRRRRATHAAQMAVRPAKPPRLPLPKKPRVVSDPARQRELNTLAQRRRRARLANDPDFREKRRAASRRWDAAHPERRAELSREGCRRYRARMRDA